MKTHSNTYLKTAGLDPINFIEDEPDDQALAVPGVDLPRAFFIDQPPVELDVYNSEFATLPRLDSPEPSKFEKKLLADPQRWLARRERILIWEISGWFESWLTTGDFQAEFPEPFYLLRDYFPPFAPGSSKEKPTLTASPIYTPPVVRCYSTKIPAKVVDRYLWDVVDNPRLQRRRRYEPYPKVPLACLKTVKERRRGDSNL